MQVIFIFRFAVVFIFIFTISFYFQLCICCSLSCPGLLCLHQGGSFAFFVLGIHFEWFKTQKAKAGRGAELCAGMSSRCKRGSVCLPSSLPALIIPHFTEPCLLSCSPAEMVLSQSWISNQLKEWNSQLWGLCVALGVCGLLNSQLSLLIRGITSFGSLLKVCTVKIKGFFPLERHWPKFIPFHCA